MRHPKQALFELICELFDTGGLLRFVTLGAEGERICRRLPPEQVSMEKMAVAVIGALYQHKVTEDFFTRLRREFPRREREIDEVHTIVRDCEWGRYREARKRRPSPLLSDVAADPWILGVLVGTATSGEIRRFVDLLKAVTWRLSIQS